jgi:hypothetical protein
MEMFNKLPYEMCGLHMMSGGFDSAGIYIQVSVGSLAGAIAQPRLTSADDRTETGAVSREEVSACPSIRTRKNQKYPLAAPC